MDRVARHLELDGARSSPGIARAAVREVASEAGVDREVAEVAVLLASELVTNAVVHGRVPIAVDAVADARAVRVEVHDAGSGIAAPRRPASDAISGRGLAIVDALATRWRAEPVPGDGKRVWFELDLRGLGHPAP
jgi:anti-sigma regulatory factor (Ser/Thr protein kinase)